MPVTSAVDRTATTANLKDPNALGQPNGRFFCSPYSVEEARVVLLPVPWEATVSYGAGTALAPQAILDASPQLDLYDFDVADAWQVVRHGTVPIAPQIQYLSQRTRAIAVEVIDYLEAGGNVADAAIGDRLSRVNEACVKLNDWVYQQSRTLIEQNKQVGIVGGDHSVPLGLMQALAEEYGEYGILQIDAHTDLRQAYEGFIYSHASIMHNALELNAITRLVGVGIRDLCEAEAERLEADDRLICFDDWQLKEAAFQGKTWALQCDRIVSHLPKHVYISFDIDGLDPRFCPHTGTPVPGGLSFNEGIFLLQTLVRSGRRIIGFDLCEVAPGADEWDANVGARLLYKLSNLTYASLSS